MLNLNSHNKYRKDIDGLRAIAVLSVIFFHAFPNWLKGGFVGVDVFFVISGYLITSIIYENLLTDSFSFWDFYSRRIRRIFPALLLVLTCSYIYGWFYLLSDDFKLLSKHITSGSLFISNLVLWSESGYFDTIADTKPLLHLWSLGIEEQFYIIWPALLFYSYRLRIGFFIPTILILLLSFCINVFFTNSNTVAAFFSPFTRFWELSFGSLIFLVRNLNFLPVSNIYKDGFKNILSTFAFLILIFSFIYLDKSQIFPGWLALFPVVASSLIIYCGPSAFVNRIFLSNKLVVNIGLISYPLYLWHWPILSFARIYYSEVPTRNTRILALILSFILSYVTYKFFERPYRFGINLQSKCKNLILLMSFISLAAFFTFSNNGFPFRTIQSQADLIFTPNSRVMENDLVNSFRATYGDLKSNKPIILSLGDSYLKNWSVAISKTINLDSYNFVAISYLGCSVSFVNNSIVATPESNEYKESCYTFESLINDKDIIDKTTSIMLVSHRPFEYKSHSYRFDILKHFKLQYPAVKIFVFGNYFQLDHNLHPSCEKLMIRYQTGAEVCIYNSVYPKDGHNILLDPLYPNDFHFQYVDIIKPVCGKDKYECPSSFGGVPFMLDWNHLSVSFLSSILPVVFSNNEILKTYIKN